MNVYEPTAEEIQRFVETAVEAALAGGEVLRRWENRFTAQRKSPADFVTEADFESQRTIYELIRSRFPDHGFLGEENTEVRETNSLFQWIVDPLDGTSNYVHRFPYYSVSVALEYDGRLLAAAVFDPTRDELFKAGAGLGAFLNDQPIQAKGAEDLNSALVIVSLPIRVERTHPVIEDFLRVLERAQHLQRTGSAALNLAYIAAGRVDAYWSRSLHPWDMAAGALLVEEAGGRVTRCDGTPLNLRQHEILATNGSAIHEQLRELLS